MIYGIGVDTVTVARMERCLCGTHGTHFLRRVFGPEEQALLASLAPVHRAQTAAACFAAKEAFGKALGTGLAGFELTEAQALRRESGAPYVRLSGAALARARSLRLAAHLSLTHEGGFATAFLVLEQSGIQTSEDAVRGAVSL